MTPSPGRELRVDVRRKSYAGGASVLSALAFSVAPTEFVSLLGPSGGGKTTLLRLISGLDGDYDGHITVAGEPIRGPGPDRGVVFQESRLMPWMSVEQNVAFALPPGVGGAERNRRVFHALEMVKLTSAARAWPYQLSGGMEKRVALARALVNLPSFLLMDEPFSAVDPSARYALQDEVARIHTRELLTTVLVTHDVDEAVHLSDRVLILTGRPGRIGVEVRVDLPRPRSRTSAAAIALQQKILDLMLASDQTGISGPNGDADGPAEVSDKRRPGYQRHGGRDL